MVLFFGFAALTYLWPTDLELRRKRISRGKLVSDFLQGSQGPEAYARAIDQVLTHRLVCAWSSEP
jgi:hypothetical protein